MRLALGALASACLLLLALQGAAQQPAKLPANWSVTGAKPFKYTPIDTSQTIQPPKSAFAAPSAGKMDFSRFFSGKLSLGAWPPRANATPTPDPNLFKPANPIFAPA